jgi:dTDP-4-dehydrorhamnose reductase
MLGTDLCKILSGQHEVFPTDIEEMDVRDYHKVFAVTRDAQPEIIIHLAALTDVDYCEKNRDDAFRTNTIGTKNVVLACQRINSTLVYVSTISIFDGTKCEPYSEFDIPNPQSEYSKSKYQGELIVESLLSQYYIIRAGWMFGGGKEDKKFVAKIIGLARSRSELRIVQDKFGSPTYTVDISNGISKLTETGLYGRYHMVNTGGSCSRYEFAQKVVEFANIGDCQLIPINSAEFPLPAHRPRMEAARNYHLELIGMNIMRPWQDALKDYIRRLESL